MIQISPDEIGRFQVEIRSLTKGQRISFAWIVDYLRKTKLPGLNLTSRFIRPGELRLYRYLPKHKLTLPYYDRVPIALIIGANDKYFTGINFHYLPPQYRKYALSRLLSNSDNLPDLTRMKNPEIYMAQTRNPLWKFAIKRYLPAFMTSPAYIIPKKEWTFLVELPVAQFVKKPQEEVWSIGRLKYRRVSRMPATVF